MQQNYFDAMSIVKKFGKPDFFITMTASPTWPEITENPRLGETAASRPDLVARVFHLKMRALLDELLDKKVLGRPLAWTWVVEFQKRGLPHLHLLLVVHPEDKPRTAEDIDKIISAELPDPADPDQRELLELVLGCMVHGPCGARNSRALVANRAPARKASRSVSSNRPCYRRAAILYIDAEKSQAAVSKAIIRWMPVTWCRTARTFRNGSNAISTWNIAVPSKRSNTCISTLTKVTTAHRQMLH